MMRKEVIRKQFNKQAKQFARFELTRNKTIFQFIVDFCKLNENDILLDVACGSGAFAVFCAEMLTHVTGIDISNELIKYAKKHAEELKLANAEFIRGDVEKLPFPDSSFSVVSCRSAFHHIENGDLVLKEMIRCVKKGGKICIQDMISYEQANVNNFFERMDKLIDSSHFRALSSQQIKALLVANNIKIESAFETTLTHNLNEYIGHAYQSQEQSEALKTWVNGGLKDASIAEFLFLKDGEICFKRSGIVIYGITS